MKILDQKQVDPPCRVAQGEFNACEHLFVEIEPGRNQTISCRLPTGEFVTFGFCMISEQDPHFECVDIHSTVGPHHHNEKTLGKDHWQMHLIGFSDQGRDSFDTRRPGLVQGKHPCTLATLLLHPSHYQEQES